MSKFKAKKTVVDGITFDSMKEAARFRDLKLLERGGAIRNLEIQPKFDLSINGTKVCSYIGDFAYFENNARVIEDVKSKPTKTPVYRLKRRMLLAQYPGIDHREV